MSNPYGGNPYGDQTPYGQPYNAPDGQGFGTPPKTDGVSIAAFVSALVCCAPVGLILGFVGLGRTKGGQRKGRWAAVTGIVLGLLGLGAWVLAGIGLAGGISFLNSLVELDDAKVGQCVDLDEADENDVFMRDKPCDEPHDAEIVYVGTYDEVADTADANGDIYSDVCLDLVDEETVAAVDEALGADAFDAWQIVLDDPTNPTDDDPFVCYVEGDLSEPLL